MNTWEFCMLSSQKTAVDRCAIAQGELREKQSISTKINIFLLVLKIQAVQF